MGTSNRKTALTLWDRDEFLMPFSTLIDQLVHKSFPELSKELGIDFFEKGSYPKADIKEFDDKIVIEAEVPGLTKDDIDIQVSGNYLTLLCDKREEVEETKAKYIRRELKKSHSTRTFVLNDNIDKDNISAEFNNGCLSITLLKLKPESIKEEVKKVAITEPVTYPYKK